MARPNSPLLPDPSHPTVKQRAGVRDAFSALTLDTIGGTLDWKVDKNSAQPPDDPNFMAMGAASKKNLKLEPGKIYDTGLAIGARNMVQELDLSPGMKKVSESRAGKILVEPIRTGQLPGLGIETPIIGDIVKGIRFLHRKRKKYQDPDFKDQLTLKVQITPDGAVKPLYKRNFPTTHFWPISELFTDYRRAVEEYKLITEVTVKAYALMGVRRLTLSFPHAHHARDISLNAVMIHLEAAQKYKATVRLDDKTEEAIILALSSKDSKQVKLALAIQAKVQDLQRLQNDDPDIAKHENQAALDEHQKKLKEGTDKLKTATEQLKNAIDFNQDNPDLIKSEMQNAKAAIDSLNTEIREVEQDILDYLTGNAIKNQNPNDVDAFKKEYEKALTDAKAEIDAAKVVIDKDPTKGLGKLAAETRDKDFAGHAQNLFKAVDGLERVQHNAYLASQKDTDRSTLLVGEFITAQNEIKNKVIDFKSTLEADLNTYLTAKRAYQRAADAKIGTNPGEFPSERIKNEAVAKHNKAVKEAADRIEKSNEAIQAAIRETARIQEQIKADIVAAKEPSAVQAYIDNLPDIDTNQASWTVNATNVLSFGAPGHPNEGAKQILDKFSQAEIKDLVDPLKASVDTTINKISATVIEKGENILQEAQDVKAKLEAPTP